MRQLTMSSFFFFFFRAIVNMMVHFIEELPKLREVHLSGNPLGGSIPIEWRNLGAVSGIGFSKMSLFSGIPNPMGLHLKSLCYLGLDNNNLEGQVPEELSGLEFVSEINLENNSLSRRLRFPVNFTSKIGVIMKLSGNSGLCIEVVLPWNVVQA
ncbi:Piriformospora indica-insensitive protein 2 [Linum grandiflorum]